MLHDFSPFILKKMSRDRRINGLLTQHGLLLMKMCPKAVYCVFFGSGVLQFHINAKFIIPFLSFLKKHTLTQYKVLTDMVASDWPLQKNRFNLVYLLLNVSTNTRCYVQLKFPEWVQLQSITKLYLNAAWLEREIWDTYGVFFYNHYDLRRLLTDYGFEGHPFRKDFPLSGYEEVRYDENEKRLISQSVEFSQEFRKID